MTKPVALAITTGNRDGIGLEVTRKALTSLGPSRSARFIVACSTDTNADRQLKLLRGFKQIHISSRDATLETAIQILNDLRQGEILVWRDAGNEAEWVARCARLALNHRLSGLITGPVSKDRFKNIDRRYMGHTGMLAHLSRVSVQQGYVGSKLSVVLATDHIPLHKVEKALTSSTLKRALNNASELRLQLDSARRRKPIAVLGLNPHAGESGIIGDFEKRLRLPRDVLGPLSADTAFTGDSLGKYSVVVALYHDQGLIPFKLLHGQDSGYQISLGLPFVRTSVDHGTAQDLFGLNKANPGSMTDAINGAIELALRKRLQKKRFQKK